MNGEGGSFKRILCFCVSRHLLLPLIVECILEIRLARVQVRFLNFL
jgi:hypothetical protein